MCISFVSCNGLVVTGRFYFWSLLSDFLLRPSSYLQTKAVLFLPSPPGYFSFSFPIALARTPGMMLKSSGKREYPYLVPSFVFSDHYAYLRSATDLPSAT